MRDDQIIDKLATAMGWRLETDDHDHGNFDWIKPNGFRYGIFDPLQEGTDTWEVIDWMESQGKRLHLTDEKSYRCVYFGDRPDDPYALSGIDLTPRHICLAALEALA